MTNLERTAILIMGIVFGLGISGMVFCCCVENDPPKKAVPFSTVKHEPEVEACDTMMFNVEYMIKGDARLQVLFLELTDDGLFSTKDYKVIRDLWHKKKDEDRELKKKAKLD